MTRYETPQEPERTAALIATMMLRFSQDDIPSLGADHPDLMFKLGDEAFFIVPDGLRLTLDDLVPWLMTLDKPVVAAPLKVRGHVGVWPGASTKLVRHNVQNQQAGLAEFLEAHPQLQEPTVLLDTGHDSLIFPFAHLREWARTYQVLVGWNVAQATDGVGAEAQMLLITPPGRRSPGWGCEIDPK